MAIELSDEELGDVAGEISNLSFRAGLLLGLQPHELDRLEVDAAHQTLKAWQMNMQLLHLWKERTSAESERVELAKVLKRLGKGKLAVRLDSSVKYWEETSAIDPSKDSLSVAELEEVSRGVWDCWKRLAVYLRVPDPVVQSIESSNEEVSVKAFRCLWAWREAGMSVSKTNLADALGKVKKGRLASQLRPATR